jgi:hypothetical protein
MSVEVKEIVDEYVVLNFDIAAKEGKFRKKILKRLAEIGAVMFTQSCYYLPFSPESMAVANEIAAEGDAVIWRSKQENKAKAKELTIKYEGAR